MLGVPKQNSGDSLRSTSQFVFWLGGFAFLSGLLILMGSGWFMRYLQDDYCFDFLLKHGGFFNAQVFTFLNEITFNGNRFSTNLVMGILAQIGPLSARLLPGLLVFGWSAALIWLVHNLDGLFKWRWPVSFIFFLSIAVVLFSLVQAPNLFQDLFWRPAAVTYLMPLVLLTVLFAWLIQVVYNDQIGIRSIILAFVGAFIVGGFSETAAIFQVGCLFLALVWIVLARPFDNEMQRSAKSLLISSFIGALFAVLVLVISPSARLRQAALFPHPPDFIGIFRISLDGIRQFLLLTFYRQTLPTLLGFLIFFFAGFLLSHSVANPLTFRKPPIWKFLFLVLLISFLLLLFIALPSAYASSSIPEERALLWSRFALVVASAALSLILGNWLGGVVAHPARRRLLITAGIFLAVTCLILVIAIPAGTLFQPAYPEIRDWLAQHPIWIGIFIFLLLITIWLFGRLKLEKRFIDELIPFLLIVLFIAAFLTGVPKLIEELPGYELRAELWDWRNAQVQAAILRGNYDIVLPALDSIAGITELQENPDHWVNNCAELYYGVKSIRAVPPVLTAIPASS